MLFFQFRPFLQKQGEFLEGARLASLNWCGTRRNFTFAEATLCLSLLKRTWTPICQCSQWGGFPWRARVFLTSELTTFCTCSVYRPAAGADAADAGALALGAVTFSAGAPVLEDIFPLLSGR